MGRPPPSQKPPDRHHQTKPSPDRQQPPREILSPDQTPSRQKPPDTKTTLKLEDWNHLEPRKMDWTIFGINDFLNKGMHIGEGLPARNPPLGKVFS